MGPARTASEPPARAQHVRRDVDVIAAVRSPPAARTATGSAMCRLQRQRTLATLATRTVVPEKIQERTPHCLANQLATHAEVKR